MAILVILEFLDILAQLVKVAILEFLVTQDLVVKTVAVAYKAFMVLFMTQPIKLPQIQQQLML